MATTSSDDGMNTDLSKRTVMHTADMEWVASPMPGVHRRRVFRADGDPEGSAVTSVVRYAAGSSFREHGHPSGEEILVLDGAWQDANGDHPTGTFMLNPEGFRHAPRSVDGCLLWVKLQQFGGEGRTHARIATADMEWVPASDGQASVSVKPLLDPTEAHPEVIRLEKWEKGATISRSHDVLSEYLLLTGGGLLEDGTELKKQSWIRFPAGDTFTFIVGSEDTEVWTKIGVWTA